MSKKKPADQAARPPKAKKANKEDKAKAKQKKLEDKAIAEALHPVSLAAKLREALANVKALLKKLEKAKYSVKIDLDGYEAEITKNVTI